MTELAKTADASSPSHSRQPVPPAVAVVVQKLRARVDRLVDRLLVEYRRSEGAYVDVPEDDLRYSIREALEASWAEMMGEGRDTRAAELIGRRRAEQGIPLSAVLHAYRLGSLLMWREAVRETGGTSSSSGDLIMVADWAFEIADEYPHAMVLGYQREIAERIARDGAERDALVRALLAGSLAKTPQFRSAATALQLPMEGTFLVLAVRPPDSDPGQVCQLDRELRSRGIRSMWQVDLGLQVGLLLLSAPGTTDEIVRAAAAVSPAAPARVGLSEVFHRLELVSEAATRARLASAAAFPGQPLRHEEGGLGLLISAAPIDAAELAERVLGPILRLPEVERATLLETLRAWLSSDGSTSAIAEALHVHRNTVRNRLDRIGDVLRRRLTDPRTLGELYAAMEALRIDQRPVG